MVLLEFETQLNDSTIRIPDEIAAQLAKGTAVRVSITPVEKSESELMSDAAWSDVLDFINQRIAQGQASTSYTWRREDAYDHIN
jgi:hypothetical protein